MKKFTALAAAILVVAVSFFPSRAQHAQQDSSATYYIERDTTHVILSGTRDSAAFPSTAIDTPRALTVIVGHDTIKLKDTINIPSVGVIVPSDHLGSFQFPAWLQTAIVAILTIIFTVLPMVQSVLKIIPTPVSVRIGGWIGKILDWATWFIKDVKVDVKTGQLSEHK